MIHPVLHTSRLPVTSSEDITRLGSTYSLNLEAQSNRKEENMIGFFSNKMVHPVYALVCFLPKWKYIIMNEC